MEMKRLNINGQVFEIRDENAVSYKSQTNRTEAEKKQARDNIDAIGDKLMTAIDPTVGLTPAALQALCKVYGYDSLAAAVDDINSQEPGKSGIDVDNENAVCALYTDDEGNLNLILFSDMELCQSITISQSCILKVNGCVIHCADDFSITFEGENNVLDCRVPGSKIWKERDTVSANEFQLKFTGSSQLLGGEVVCSAKSSNMTDSNISIAVLVGSGELLVDGCTITNTIETGGGVLNAIRSQGYLQLHNAQCVATAKSAYAVAVFEIAKAAGFYGKNSKLIAESSEGGAYGYYARSGSGNCKLEGCLVHSTVGTQGGGIYSAAALGLTMIDTEVFADGLSGSTAENGWAIGIQNNGYMNLTNCQVYGIHSGVQCGDGSTTLIDGGIYEGVGHGGVYLCHLGGSFFAQNAEFKTANYRGKYKAQFQYASTYRYAAVYIGGSDGNSDLSAYFDNCIIDGGGPCPVSGDDGDDLGAEPIRFRGSASEKNNAIYISNCTLMGDGKIRFGNATHKLFLGLGNRVLCEASIPSCVDSTSYAGQVFTGSGEE